MLTAIIFILLLSLVLALTLSLSSSTVQQTTNRYAYEQARILAKSATEYAILAIQSHDYTSGCLKSINMRYPNTPAYLFDINITLHYIGSNLPCNPSEILVNDVKWNESNSSVLIDTRVSLNPALLKSSNPITYTKRTIQKL